MERKPKKRAHISAWVLGLLPITCAFRGACGENFLPSAKTQHPPDPSVTRIESPFKNDERTLSESLSQLHRLQARSVGDDWNLLVESEVLLQTTDRRFLLSSNFNKPLSVRRIDNKEYLVCQCGDRNGAAPMFLNTGVWKDNGKVDEFPSGVVNLQSSETKKRLHLSFRGVTQPVRLKFESFRGRYTIHQEGHATKRSLICNESPNIATPTFVLVPVGYPESIVNVQVGSLMEMSDRSAVLGSKVFTNKKKYQETITESIDVTFAQGFTWEIANGIRHNVIFFAPIPPGLEHDPSQKPQTISMYGGYAEAAYPETTTIQKEVKVASLSKSLVVYLGAIRQKKYSWTGDLVYSNSSSRRHVGGVLVEHEVESCIAQQVHFNLHATQGDGRFCNVEASP